MKNVLLVTFTTGSLGLLKAFTGRRPDLGDRSNIVGFDILACGQSRPDYNLEQRHSIFAVGSRGGILTCGVNSQQKPGNILIVVKVNFMQKNYFRVRFEFNRRNVSKSRHGISLESHLSTNHDGQVGS